MMIKDELRCKDLKVIPSEKINNKSIRIVHF